MKKILARIAKLFSKKEVKGMPILSSDKIISKKENKNKACDIFQRDNLFGVATKKEKVFLYFGLRTKEMAQRFVELEEKHSWMEDLLKEKRNKKEE